MVGCVVGYVRACVRECSCLDEEEVDEGLLGHQPLVLLGEEVLFEEELRAALLHAQRLGARVGRAADLADGGRRSEKESKGNLTVRDCISRLEAQRPVDRIDVIHSVDEGHNKRVDRVQRRDEEDGEGDDQRQVDADQVDLASVGDARRACEECR